jgi:predicted small lipoprotein YifL
MGARQIVLSRARRGFGRAAVFLILAATLAVCGCGRKGHGAQTDSEKAADVAILNDSLAGELTAVAAFERALPLLRGGMLVVAREFRGQDQAHVDALTKAIRGLGGEAEAEAAELEAPGPRDEAEALVLAYEAENTALAEDLAAPPRLQTSAPRAVTAAIGANHAQHLVVLRQGLGVPLRDVVPQPYESGDLPPPTTAASRANASK